VLGDLSSRKAAEQGRKQKKNNNLARPYQAKGAEYNVRLKRESSPIGSTKQLQAVQAQVAQQAAGRGGAVGAAQMQAQMRRLPVTSCCNSNMTTGLKTSGIGDQVALGAIKTGMQAGEYVNQLTNQSFWKHRPYLVWRTYLFTQQQPNRYWSSVIATATRVQAKPKKKQICLSQHL